MPPSKERIADSVRKSVRMSACVAPTARRMPISLMRSMTVAYMMFMIPMPPTRSETEPMPMRILLAAEKMVPRAWRSSA